MTAPVLALPRLYLAVKALFTSEALVVSVPTLYAFTGTAKTGAALTGTPTSSADVVVRYPTGGTVGVDGIVYEVSVDGGTTWGAPTQLGTSAALAPVAGVTLTLGAGTVVTNDRIAWSQTGPNPVSDQAFGWSEPSHRAGGLRIVWVPGDDEANGNLGELAPARNSTEDEELRSLATLRELVTVYLEARDATDPSELAQYTAGRLLYDAFLRAVHVHGYGTYEVISQRWDRPTLVSASGATIRVLLAIEAKVPDAPATFAPATAHANETAFNSPTTTDPDQADPVQRIDPA